MWRVTVKYEDGSVLRITGKTKDIWLSLARDYYAEYGRRGRKILYQQYPKKEHEQVELREKIAQLESEEKR